MLLVDVGKGKKEKMLLRKSQANLDLGYKKT